MKKSILIIALAVAAAACNNGATKSTPEQTEETQTQETTPDLYGQEWSLVELNSKAITVDTTFQKKPHLIFEKDSSRAVGNGGCNSFSANFELKENDGIELSHAVATQMACPNMDIEQQFFEILTKVKGYQIDGNSLTLYNENKEALARLEASAQ
ncbi:MAG: META domain-containing protein [Niabella sp.]